MFSISVCNVPFFFQLRHHASKQPRLCRTKKISRSRCSHLARFKFSTDLVPYLPYPSIRPYGARDNLGTRLIFDRTGQKFDLNLSVQIFKRLGDQILVWLAWFRVNGTPKRSCFHYSIQPDELMMSPRSHVACRSR